MKKRANLPMEQEIEDLIAYAVKEGYLDEDTAQEMTWEEKERYFNKCQAYDII